VKKWGHLSVNFSVTVKQYRKQKISKKVKLGVEKGGLLFWIALKNERNFQMQKA